MKNDLRKVDPDQTAERRGLLSRLGRLYGRFARDRRGGTAVQAIAFMPVILLTFVMGAKLWQVLLIKRSLHHGVYTATRFLSVYPPDTATESEWEAIAEDIIHRELANNPFVDPIVVREGSPFTEVRVDLLNDSYSCKDNFTVSAKYPVWRVSPDEGDYDFTLPNLDRIVLTQQRLGEVLCD